MEPEVEYYELNYISPSIHMLKSYHLKVFGDEAFTEVISIKWDGKGGTLIQYDFYPNKRDNQEFQ